MGCFAYQGCLRQHRSNYLFGCLLWVCLIMTNSVFGGLDHVDHVTHCNKSKVYVYLYGWEQPNDEYCTSVSKVSLYESEDLVKENTIKIVQIEAKAIQCGTTVRTK